MTSEILFPYDVELFSRNFLNCAQRHSIVMLKAAGFPVERLFDTAFMSTDQIFEHSIRQRQPKYDFGYDGLTDESFQRIGVLRTSHFIDRFEDARAQILDLIARDGFVLLAGDVFYFPHCPEYRNKHLFHLVILTGWDAAAGEWLIVDDNPASVLCHYRWGDQMVAAFYDNSPVREFRSYQHIPPPHSLPTTTGPGVSERTDSLQLLTELPALLQSNWFAPDSLFPSLGEAFSILSGSRRCFAAFLRAMNSPVALAEQADAIADAAQKMRNRLVRARITGIINLLKIEELANELAFLERRLYDDLVAAAAAVGCPVDA